MDPCSSINQSYDIEQTKTVDIYHVLLQQVAQRTTGATTIGLKLVRAKKPPNVTYTVVLVIWGCQKAPKRYVYCGFGDFGAPKSRTGPGRAGPGRAGPCRAGPGLLTA